jgi:hypothetical protein
MSCICAIAELGITAIRTRLEMLHSKRRTNCFMRFRTVQIGTRPESRFIPYWDQTGVPVYSKLGPDYPNREGDSCYVDTATSKTWSSEVSLLKSADRPPIKPSRYPTKFSAKGYWGRMG